MNGYSRIRLTNSNKSSSRDFSDLLSSPEPIKETAPKPQYKTPQNTKSNGHNNPTSEPEEYDQAEEDDWERCGEVLRRSYSVSSAAASHGRFIRFDKQLGSSVKRAISMRRSSSVSERYYRIHDQCVTTLGVGPTSFDENTEVSMKKKKKKQHRTGRILKACKRIFGLQS